MNSEQHALPATTQAQQEVRLPSSRKKKQAIHQTTNAQMTITQLHHAERLDILRHLYNGSFVNLRIVSLSVCCYELCPRARD